MNTLNDNIVLECMKYMDEEVLVNFCMTNKKYYHLFFTYYDYLRCDLNKIFGISVNLCCTNIVKFLIDKGPNRIKSNIDVNYILTKAAGLGNIYIVKLMMKYDADEVNLAMIKAAKNGHIEIEKLMKKNGADYFKNEILYKLDLE